MASKKRPQSQAQMMGGKGNRRPNSTPKAKKGSAKSGRAGC